MAKREPCADRSRTAAPLLAGSVLPRTPLALPARIAPRLSSPSPLPILAEDLLLPDFYSGASGRFSEGFSLRRLQSIWLAEQRSRRASFLRFCRRLIVTDAALAVLSLKLSPLIEDVYVLGKPIEQRAGEPLGGEDGGPLVEGQITGDDNRDALLALAEDLEQQRIAHAQNTMR